ncbi:hypothetical protein SeLEV6574_g06619 [Synchytrium endobioticum]|uniref:Uncharacterized protein n=2 Tax=Synchytrium endobioticum TaxID=286115 RepID=A0A507CMP9_9FUNG|nr:hypothetical protein SeLEV6574_g06619 [Synchytrium endobioticum]
MEASAILHLLRWVRNYYQDMNARLGVGEELLEPKLIDGKQDQLVTEYVHLIRTKLAEWMGNLLASETREFLHRHAYPDTDAAGRYTMSASIIMFQMVNQQVDIVSSSSRGALMHDVLAECTTALDEFHRAWLRLIDAEHTRFVERSADLAEGLPEYTMAVGNDAFRAREFAEALATRMDALVDPDHAPRVRRRLDTTLDGFMRLATRCNAVLIDIVLCDIRPALAQLHTPSWYDNNGGNNNNPMAPIIATLDDYCTDFSAHLCEHLLTKLKADLLERFVVAYIESFRNKAARFRVPACVDRFRADLDNVKDFFAKLKTAKRVNQAFDAVDKLVAFVCSTGGLAFLDFWSLYNPYRDLPISFVEELVDKREDLDRAAKKELIENCKSKVAEESAKRKEPITPTVFGKINVGKEHK